MSGARSSTAASLSALEWESLARTARGAAGLPGSFFCSEQIYALEVERFFRRQWFCVGLSSDVAHTGDWSPVEVFGESLVIGRDAQGGIRVFHNICSHRGARIVRQPCHARAIVCPYHCWTYDTNGRLLKTPHAGGADCHDDPSVDRGALGLREVAAVERGGLVFMCLGEPAESFEARIGPMFERWSTTDFSALQPLRSLAQRPRFRANWKIVVENFVESYHLPMVHPELNAANPMERHYQILGGDRYVGQGSLSYQRPNRYAQELPLLPGGPKDRSTGEALYLVSNLMVINFPGYIVAIILFPDGPTATAERLELFVHPEAASSERYNEQLDDMMKFWASVNDEDIGICESVQAGRSSAAFRGGVFTRGQEITSLQFQQILARCLLGPDESWSALPAEDVHHPVAASATTVSA